ncbi:MAG TPA: polymer-forming cytoskeletal protein [Thermoanaerobaculia bacterium]|nr:polymer-forming cytoskeletal protein [Thermoanaerobaculia bacterium]
MAIFAKEQAPAPKPNIPKHDTDTGSPSILGRHLVFDGALSGSESLLIEGTVKGRIELGSDLRIGLGGRVEATVHAASVIIEGTLIGDVSADRKVELVARSSVDGNIRAPKIIVSEGATFRGSVDMGAEKPKS